MIIIRTFESAKVSSCSLINSLNYILENKVDYIISIIRLPGHRLDNSKGFCIFNSVDIIVEYFKSKTEGKK